MFTIEPRQATVPAGGETSVVTANTKIDAPDGVYSGVVNATGGELVLDGRRSKQIAFTVDKPNARTGAGAYRNQRETGRA